MSDRNFNRALLLVKEEVTDGTYSTPDVANNPVAILEPFVPDGDFSFRNPRPRLVRGAIIEHAKPLKPSGWVGSWPYIVQGRGSRNGGAYAAGAAATRLELEADLLAAGCSVVYSGGAGSEIVTVRPAATSLKSVSKDYYVDGALHQLLGAKNEITVEIDAGGPVRFNIVSSGLYQAPGASALPAITAAQYGTAIPPICEDVDVSINFGGGAFTTGIIRSFRQSFGNTPQQRPSFAGTLGLAPPKIRHREPTWSLVLEFPVPGGATDNFEAYDLNNLAAAISFTVGTVQYNKMTFTAPAAGITSIKKQDDNGTLVAELSGGLHSSDGVALDAFEWKFT